MSFLSKLGKGLSFAAPIAASFIPGVGGATGLLGKLGKGIKSAAGNGILGGAGAALGAMSQSSASNRGTTIDALLEQAKLRELQRGNTNTATNAHDRLTTEQQNNAATQDVNRSVENRASGNDAFMNMQRAAYVAGRDKGYTPGVGSNGKPLASFGFGPHASTPDEVTGANAFKAEAMDRLQGGPQIMERAMPGVSDVQQAEQFTIDPKLMHAGTFETLAGAAGAGMGTFDLLTQMRQRQQKQDEAENGRLAGQVESRYGSAG